MKHNNSSKMYVLFLFQTLSLLETVKYENAFLFMYSMREKTHAHRNYVDDVPLDAKKDRLKRMIDIFTEVQRPLNQV